MKREKINLFRDLIMIRRLKDDDNDKRLRQTSGLVLELESETRFADVIAVGKKVRGIEPGDRIVLMGETPGGQELRWNGEDCVIMREKYVFGIVEAK